MTETFLLVFIAMVTLLNIASALYVRDKVKQLVNDTSKLVQSIIVWMGAEDA